MRCAEVAQLLSAYEDSELQPEKKALVEAHLAQCASCAAAHEELCSADAVLRRLPVPAVPGGLAAQIRAAVLHGRPAPGVLRDRFIERLIPLPLLAAACLLVFTGYAFIAPAVYGGQNARATEKAVHALAGLRGSGLFGPANFARFCDCCHEMVCVSCAAGKPCACRERSSR